MNRLAIFDCDGTLVDSAADICLAMAQAFDEGGLAPPAPAAIRKIVGLSLAEAVAALLPDGEGAVQAGIVARYKLAFHAMRGRGSLGEPLFPGIVDVLDALAADGFLLGVATGKSDRGLRLCLERHGIAGRFLTLQTADRHPSKPHPSMALQCMAETGAGPATTVVIGDTSYDIAMARAAGARAIGVAWGYHAHAELAAEGADAVADRPSDLPRLCRELV